MILTLYVVALQNLSGPGDNGRSLFPLLFTFRRTDVPGALALGLLLTLIGWALWQ